MPINRPNLFLLLSLLLLITFTSYTTSQSPTNPISNCSLESTATLSPGEIISCCVESRHFAVTNPSKCCDVTATPNTLLTTYVPEFCCNNDNAHGVPLTYSTTQCCNCSFNSNLCCSDTTWVRQNNAQDVCCIDKGSSISASEKSRCCNWYRSGSGPDQTSCLRSKWLEWGFQNCSADCDPSSSTYSIDCCLRKGGFSEPHCCDVREYVGGSSAMALPGNFNTIGCCTKYGDNCNIDMVNGFSPLPTQNNVQAQVMPNPDNVDSISHLHCCMAASSYVDLGYQGHDERLWAAIGKNCCAVVKVHLAVLQQYPYLSYLISKCLDDTNPTTPNPPVTPTPCKEDL